MMRALSPRLMIGTLVAVLAASSCGYDPQPDSGTLMCGADQTCPDGYMCASGYCYKNGICNPLASSFDRMIGRWTFVAPSRRLITCSDGSSDDDKMWMDYLDIDVGVAFPLQSFYYCSLDLDFDPVGTSTVLLPNLGCSAPDPMDASITYTWAPQSFTVTTQDGCRGTLSASIPYEAVSSAGTVTCTMDFTGTLSITKH
jgi:hypothetical protein